MKKEQTVSQTRKQTKREGGKPGKKTPVKEEIENEEEKQEEKKTEKKSMHTIDRDAQINPRMIMEIELDEAPESFMTSLRHLLPRRRKLGFLLRLFVKFAIHDAKAHKVSYAIKFFAVFLVVFLCVALLSTLFYLPIVFLRLADANRGQNDLYIKPGGRLGAGKSLNYSIVEEMFPSTDESRGYHSPRIYWSANIMNLRFCPGVDNVKRMWYTKSNQLCPKGCVLAHCVSNKLFTHVIAINEERERRMEFGNSWGGPSKINPREVILSRETAVAANVSQGDSIVLYGDVSSVLKAALQPFSSLAGRRYVLMQFNVTKIVPTARSKFGHKTFAAINYDSMISAVADGVIPTANQTEVMKFGKVNPKICATSIHFNMNPKTRMNTYMSTDFTVIRRRVTLWASSIIDPLGFNQVTLFTDVLTFLHSVRFFSLFVGIIISIILLSLAFLSFMLIYSLLNLTTESHVYDFGIRRMIGFSRIYLLCMLVIEVYSFTIPSWICGLIIGQVTYIGMRAIVSSILGVHMPLLVPWSSIGWATLIGFLLPFLGAVLPMYSVLHHDLSTALNSSRGGNAGTKYKIIRKDDGRSFKFLLFFIGVVFAVCGFLLYFLFPLGLFRMQLSLVFSVFLGSLISMMLGFILLIINFEGVIQKILSYVFLFFFENQAIFQAVQKCLLHHQGRNKKTTLMYSFSLGFILFVTIAFGIQLQSFQYSIKRSMGAEVVVDFEPTNIFKLSGIFAFVKAYLPEVAGYAYLSQPIISKWPVRNVSLYTLGRYEGVYIHDFQAISPSYFEVLNKKALSVDLYNKKSKEFAISGALYNAERNNIIMSTSMHNALYPESLEDPILLTSAVIKNGLNKSVEYVRIAVKPSAVLNSAPQLDFSALNSGVTPVLTSLPSLARLSGVHYIGMRHVLIQTVSLHVPEANDVEHISITVGRYIQQAGILRSNIRDNNMISYLGIANKIIGLFSTFTEIITLIICFFSLLGTMIANVTGSTKEIGIYRCIGMTKYQIYRIFMWEAFIIIIASGSMGMVVGVAVGYAMQLHNYLFTQLNIPFLFPYMQVVIMLGMAFITAFLSSYAPVTVIMRLPSITHILRRTM